MNLLNTMGTRTIVTLVSILIIGVIAVITTITGNEVPESARMIITALMTFVGYYFGKSTALDMPSVPMQKGADSTTSVE